MRDVAEVFPGVAKTCPGCGYIKPISAFHGNAGKRDGAQPRCKSCLANRTRSTRRSLRSHERAIVVAREAAFVITVDRVADTKRYEGVRGGLLLAGYVK